MLTATRSRAWRKTAHVLALPVIAAFSLIWVNNGHAHKRERQGNIVRFGGNTFELGQPMLGGKQATPMQGTIVLGGGPDATQDGTQVSATPPAKDHAPAAKGPEQAFTFSLSPVPVKMNGELIYDALQLSDPPALPEGSGSLLALVVDGAGEAFRELSDGRYVLTISDVVVDKSGHVVYYTASPVIWEKSQFMLKLGEDFETRRAEAAREKKAHPIAESLQARIQSSVERVLDGLAVTPGRNVNEPVISLADFEAGHREVIIVDNHQVRLERR